MIKNNSALLIRYCGKKFFSRRIEEIDIAVGVVEIR